MGDLQDKGGDGIFGLELERFKSNVGKKSLPSRIELLFRHVPIKKHRDIRQEEDAYYKASKLDEADDLRNRIIHGNGLPIIALTKSSAVTSFLHEAALTARRSLAFEFGLSIDFRVQARTEFQAKGLILTRRKSSITPIVFARERHYHRRTSSCTYRFRSNVFGF